MSGSTVWLMAKTAAIVDMMEKIGVHQWGPEFVFDAKIAHVESAGGWFCWWPGERALQFVPQLKGGDFETEFDPNPYPRSTHNRGPAWVDCVQVDETLGYLELLNELWATDIALSDLPTR